VPLANPVTMQLVAVGPEAVHVNPPGLEVTVYPVIADPPLDAGIVHETVDCPDSTVPLTAVGASGVVIGVTGLERPAFPFPNAFVATTENVYGVPLVSPDTMQLVAVAPEAVHVNPPGSEVTV